MTKFVEKAIKRKGINIDYAAKSEKIMLTVSRKPLEGNEDVQQEQDVVYIIKINLESYF